MSLAIRLLPAAAILFGMDALLFRSGWYTPLLDPDSSAANVERLIRTERGRQSQNAKFHVVAVGDSRMGFFARFGNERFKDEGFRFGTIAMGGAGPRCWNYMLRGVDPNADRYSAIILPLNDYDDRETLEVLAARLTDLHYLSGQLQVSDIPDFAGSYPEWEQRWQAARGILFKGFLFKKDVQAFAEQPKERIERVRLFKDWAQWVYDYQGESRNLVGLEVDRKNKTAKIPPGAPDHIRGIVEREMLADRPEDRGDMSAYRRRWLGRIVDRYRGGKTKLIFLRLPRSPIPAEDPPANPNSSVRGFAREPHVVLTDEHLFDSLEKPDLFMDPLHLNGKGIELFSNMVAAEVRRILTQ